MFCKNCGQIIADGEMFCGNCGARVDHPTGNQPINPIMPGSTGTAMPGQVSAPKPPKKKSKKAALIVIPVVLVVAVVIAVVAIYKKTADTPLAKIMSAAENMISSGDTYEVSGNIADELSFEGILQIDIRNGIVVIDDFTSTEETPFGSSTYDAKVYYSANDEVFASESNGDDYTNYTYNRDSARYDAGASTPAYTSKKDKADYRIMTTAFSTIFSILNSDLYQDADKIADSINQFLKDNDIDFIVLEDNFADCLQQFLKDAAEEDFQTEVFGLKSADNGLYEFEIDTNKIMRTLIDYFISAVTFKTDSLETVDGVSSGTGVTVSSPLSGIKKIELSVQLNDNMIQDIHISFSVKMDGETEDVDISLHAEKSDETIAIDTDAIKEKAEG